MSLTTQFYTKEAKRLEYNIHKKILEEDGMQLRNVLFQTAELCEIAIKQNPNAVKYVNLHQLRFIFRSDEIKFYNIYNNALLKKIN